MSELAETEVLCKHEQRDNKMEDDGLIIVYCKACKRIFDIFDINQPRYKKKKMVVR